jgi:succinylglutamate desuccinylase
MEITIRIVMTFISLGTLMSCGQKVDSSLSEDKELENHIMAYKKAVVYECINSGTNSHFQRFSSNNNDLALAIEVGIIDRYNVEKARQVGAKFSDDIRSSNYMDHEGRKPIFSNCISYGFSKEVDSLARLNYQESRE